MTLLKLILNLTTLCKGRWYRNGALWAAENGILNGYGNNIFGSGDTMTREQFIAALWRYAGSPESNSNIINYTYSKTAKL